MKQPLSMLLRGRILCASSRRPYMVLRRVREPGLISLAISSLKWGFQKFHWTSSDTMILTVYVDDILLTESDGDGIEKTK